MCFDFLYKILCETFLVLRIIQRDIIINVHWVFMQSTRHCCQILIKMELPRHILAKIKAWLTNDALQGKKKLDDSSRLDVVEIACVPDLLPRVFPSWTG